MFATIFCFTVVGVAYSFVIDAVGNTLPMDAQHTRARQHPRLLDVHARRRCQ